AEAGAGDEGPGGVAAAGAGERAGAGGLAVGDGLEVGDAVAVVLGEEDGGAVVGEGGGEALGGVDVGAVDEGDQVGVPVAGGDALVSVVEEDVRGNGGRDCGGFGGHVSVFRVCGWWAASPGRGVVRGWRPRDAAEPGGGSTRPSSVVVLWSGRGRLRVEGENAGRLVADVLRDRVGEVVVGAQ